jgi:hypothetical protein
MHVSWPERNRKLGAFDVLGLVGIGGLLVARFIPVARIVPFWGCAFRRITGWPCPGCGLTRAADHFSHFHWAVAVKSNPLGTVAAAAFAVLGVWTLLHLAFKVPFPDVSLSDREWKVLRYSAVLAFGLNYAFVIVQHRFPGLLWS